MKILCPSLNRSARLGVIHFKNYFTFTEPNWCVAPFWGTKYGVRLLHDSAPLVSTSPNKNLNILSKKPIAEYLNNKTVLWQDVITAIKNCPEYSVNESAINICILRSCVHLNLFNAGISFYKYITSNGRQLSPAEFFIILKLFQKNYRKIPQFENIIKDLLSAYKSYIESIQVLQMESCLVFSNIKDTWKEMIEICERKNMYGQTALISKAFDYDEPDIGWNLLNKNTLSFASHIVQSYFNYCIRQAKANRFSVSLINDITDFCQKCLLMIPYKNILDIQSFVSALNDIPNHKYKWSVEISEINPAGFCSCCNLLLNEVTISETDFQKLRSHLVTNKMITSFDCKLSLAELNSFNLFLSKNSSYNLVVDGLNLLYRKQIHLNRRKEMLVKILINLKARYKNILFILKQHLKKTAELNIIRQHCAVFLTHDTCNDDVFTIYAALYKGIGTFILSEDFFRGYSMKLNDEELKIIYKKWSLSHHCNFNHFFNKVHRHPHAFLPQSTNVKKQSMDKEEFCWHLPCDKNITARLSVSEHFCWVCLRAKCVE